MSVWFEGKKEIECSLDHVKQSLEDFGEHYVGVIRHMPGLSTVELVEAGEDFVTIKTNEGVMKRTNITKRIEDDRVIMEFDEEYIAGSMITTGAHFVDEFSASGDHIIYHITMTDLTTSGIIGFIYKTFGKSNIGNAFLDSYKKYFDA